jgi:hypothetical protein
VFFCSFWSVFRFDEVFLQNKRVSCSQACRPGAVASTGEENDCGIFFFREFFQIPKYKLSFCECGILAVYKTRSHFIIHSYVCDALSKLIFAGELEVCGTSDEGASLHNPVSS